MHRNGNEESPHERILSSASIMFIDDDGPEQPHDQAIEAAEQHACPHSHHHHHHHYHHYYSQQQHIPNCSYPKLEEKAHLLMNRISIHSTNSNDSRKSLTHKDSGSHSNEETTLVPILSDEDVEVLRDSFNLVKADAIDVGALGVKQ